ncbi:M14 family metallopeptidase [Novosphingobium rosa]|uniref:succinylglutamate desuccinylase/aspartoacylase domain-containing protein n=1 Tax=Novosphingobium rosa TaxID=76978 RepID=UPI00083006F3|nr:succinylglutamate desuccinylase/aspartoacylase family protein [Novosphingobium rosa]
MTHTIDTVALPATSPGTCRQIRFHRFKGGSGPRVYVQAALHANETPGLVILHHLLAAVIEADRKGEIQGEIVLVPYANPIGLSDNVLGNQIGREALDGGGNYNRGWPDLGQLAVSRLAGRLGDDQMANQVLIRAEIAALLAALPRPNEVVAMQLALLSEASRADIVLDVHTELVAVPGMVVGPWSMTRMQALVDRVAPDVVHVTDTPLLFDSASSRIWHTIAEAYPEAAIGQPCVSATLELRGVTDVSDELAGGDAAAIMDFLRDSGVITSPAPAATPWPGTLSPHKAILMQRTPVGGVIVYRQPLGTRVAQGQHIADIIDPAADDPEQGRTPLFAAREGLLYAYILNHLVRPNDIVVKIAGSDVWTPEAPE